MSSTTEVDDNNTEPAPAEAETEMPVEEEAAPLENVEENAAEETPPESENPATTADVPVEEEPSQPQVDEEEVPAPSTTGKVAPPLKTEVTVANPIADAPAETKPAPPVAAARPPVPASNPTVVTTAPAVTRPLASTATSKSKKKKAPAIVTMAAAPAQAGGTVGAAGENTGRWTSEEHRLFLQGLEQHGKGWKKIASLIKSRTVVQIRTHAQKYFQKLAKARQNGEEGDVTMEGRGGLASVTSVSTGATLAQTNKRRRQTTGTKRKAIHSVVVSVQRQGKKIAAAGGMPDLMPSLPAVAPTLAHFVLPHVTESKNGKAQSRAALSEGAISSATLEDSLFRFLTPHPIATSEPVVNEVARQAGANPITLPGDTVGNSSPGSTGEISPTGVSELALYPSWTDAKDTPSWYAKGADVDALLDVGDTLDWLDDSGDLHETYQPPPATATAPSIPTLNKDTVSGSTNTLPHIDSNMAMVPELPSLFDGTPTSDGEHPPGSPSPSAKRVPSATALAAAAGVTSSESHTTLTGTEDDHDHLQVFDTPMDEHDFVSTILETDNHNESSVSLSNLS